MYRTICVKFNSKKILPTIPQTSEVAFKAVILQVTVSHKFSREESA